MRMEMWELNQMRALPAEMKIAKSIARIREWHDHLGTEFGLLVLRVRRSP
jgi:hypothetical protein